MSAMKIAVLYGGVSAERKVSIRSGRAVAEALRLAGHEVLPLDITSEEALPCLGLSADVAFPALHGRFGEDGGIQTILEREGIPYVGSNPEASANAFDKLASKHFFAWHGVPTPDSRTVEASMRWEEMEESFGAIGLPAVVKPVSQGSSVGVTLAETADELAAGLAQAFCYGRRALLERCIRGRELTVGILEDWALPIVELRPRQKFFDTYAKYQDEGTEYIPNPDLPTETSEEVIAAALQAHRCLGCSGMSRVDLILGADGRPYVLEVNTIPGFTARSLFPLAAQTAGIEFPALCERLCRHAIEGAATQHAYA